jgi:hypothetical protein
MGQNGLKWDRLFCCVLVNSKLFWQTAVLVNSKLLRTSYSIILKSKLLRTSYSGLFLFCYG